MHWCPCPAHVEGDSLHRQQHHCGPDSNRKSCVCPVVQSTVQMQCKVYYDLLLALPQDLQAAKALCHHPPHCPARPFGVSCWSKVHYMCGRQEFPLTGAHLWDYLCHLCGPDPHSCLLDGQLHHPKFLQPLGIWCSKARAGGLPLFGLGSLRPFAAWWRATVLCLVLWRILGTWPLLHLPPQSLGDFPNTHQELCLMLIWQERVVRLY